MQTIEISYPNWRRSLDEFSEVHEGWLTSVDVLEPSLGAQPEMENLPLIGVSAEPHDGKATITIAAGVGGEAQLTHTIRDASRIRLERREDGAEVALGIESVDGTTTVLRFRSVALPETVDGVAPTASVPGPTT